MQLVFYVLDIKVMASVGTFLILLIVNTTFPFQSLDDTERGEGGFGSTGINEVKQ